MSTLLIYINKPIAVVWKFFVNPQNWESWWGDGLKSVEPRWEMGAKLIWQIANPSTIINLQEQELVQIEDQAINHIFRFAERGSNRTLFEYEFETRTGAFFSDGGLAHKSRKSASLEQFKKLVEAAEPGSPLTRGSAIHKRDTLSIISLVLGGISLFIVCILPPAGLLLSMAGMILGVIGYKTSQKATISIAGIVTSTFGFLGNGVLTAILVQALLASK